MNDDAKIINILEIPYQVAAPVARGTRKNWQKTEAERPHLRKNVHKT